jgi:hypothetical protein
MFDPVAIAGGWADHSGAEEALLEESQAPILVRISQFSFGPLGSVAKPDLRQAPELGLHFAQMGIKRMLL